MITHRKHLLTGAVLASAGILLAGCSGSSNTTSEPLRNDSTAVSGITVHLEDTPGEWVEAMEITEENKKKVNDFQVTTVSGECYFASETILASNQVEKDDAKESATPTEKAKETSEGAVKYVESKKLDGEGKETKESESKESKLKQESVTYKVKSNEGELVFEGVLKDDSAPLTTTLNDGTTVQLTYGCNPGMLKDKEKLKSNLKEMVALVDIEIERDDK